MNATNAGVTPDPGLTYSNLFIFNSRDELRGPEGELVATGEHAVMIDLNTLAWVSRNQVLGGARFSATATFLFSNNSLASDAVGPLGSGGGFGDFFCQPFILGWQTRRASFRLAYGVLAPTGRFEAGASDNVGSGYWTHAPSSGLTFYPTSDERTALSAFVMYELHGTQQDTGIHPGETLDLDYSLTRTLRLRESLQLQVGLIGYSQWQTTGKTGPGLTAEESGARYSVSAVGVAVNLMLPAQKASLGLKYLTEVRSRSTFQGLSLQISAAIRF
ncbi:MAG TPA: transporter [Vicinamibacteria bacterium]|nr:transporter [Vicinamibacteria bacterium]